MSFSYKNSEIKQKYEALPKSIKNKIELNADEIKTEQELNELVRRIRSAETGRIF